MAVLQTAVLSTCAQGSVSLCFLFDQTYHHNESCGRETKRIAPYRSSEMATRAYLAYHCTFSIWYICVLE